ncbi:hypothetical protein TWF718_005660 [Orbilia javanica]|uniref:Uncharacterized protein n=1 Tax=Orbilia javanica TaxID=47235 RepID=A0AAN8MSA1_9PEZI
MQDITPDPEVPTTAVLHNADVTLPDVERDPASMAVSVTIDRSSLPPNWPMPPCEHITRVEWSYYVREGRFQRSNVNRFWANRREDAEHLPFEMGAVPNTWTYGNYRLEVEHGFEFGPHGRLDLLWAGVVAFIVGFYGPRKRLSKDYRRCKIQRVASDGPGSVTLYDVVLSPTDGLLVIYGSNRPQDSSVIQTTPVFTGEGHFLQNQIIPRYTWSEMVYSIWRSQAPTPSRAIKRPVGNLQRSPSPSFEDQNPPVPKLDSLRYIIFRGLDTPKAIEIIHECYHKLKLDPRFDMLVVTHLDKMVKSLVFDVLLMAPGIRGAYCMISEYCNGLKFKFVEKILVKWSSDGRSGKPMLPTVMLILENSKLPNERPGWGVW